MSRNLDRRVEILFPVEDKRLKQKVKQVLDIELEDNMKTHVMQKSGMYDKIDKRGKTLINSQEILCKIAKKGNYELELITNERVFHPIESPIDLENN